MQSSGLRHQLMLTLMSMLMLTLTLMLMLMANANGYYGAHVLRSAIHENPVLARG